MIGERKMKFVVEGKEFDNYEEAQKYEEELSISLKKREYFDFIISHMGAYVCKDKTGKEVVFAVITDGDASKYAHAMAGKKYGVEFSIDDNSQVVTNWELLPCDDRFSYTLARHIVGDCQELNIPFEVIQTIDFDQYLVNKRKVEQMYSKEGEKENYRRQRGNHCGCHSDFHKEKLSTRELAELILFGR